MNEDVNLTIAKIGAAAGLLSASHGQHCEGAKAAAIDAAAKYLAEVFKPK